MTTNTLDFFHLLYNLVLHSAAPLTLKTLIPPYHSYFGLKPAYTNSGMPKTAFAEDSETRAGWYFFEPEKELWSNYWEACNVGVVGEGGMVRLFDCLGKRWAQIIGSFEKPGGPRNWDSIVISFFTGGGGGATNLVYPSSLSRNGRMTLQRAHT